MCVQNRWKYVSVQVYEWPQTLTSISKPDEHCSVFLLFFQGRIQPTSHKHNWVFLLYPGLHLVPSAIIILTKRGGLMDSFCLGDKTLVKSEGEIPWQPFWCQFAGSCHEWPAPFCQWLGSTIIPPISAALNRYIILFLFPRKLTFGEKNLA